jgi:hypothetical protein
MPELVRSAADELLPSLAALSMRDATAQLVSDATAEITGVVVRKATGEVRAAIAGVLGRQAADLLDELAGTAVANALRDGSAAMTDAAQIAVVGAAPAAVHDAAEKVRGALEYAVRQEVGDVLPGLARAAMTDLTPDLQRLLDELVDKASAAVTEKAAPDLVATVSEDALKELRGTIREEAAKAFEQYAPNVVTVVLPRGQKVGLGADTHEVLPELLVALHARCHVLLVGPAGTTQTAWTSAAQSKPAKN